MSVSMKTAYNHLPHCYETPDGTYVDEICDVADASESFRAASIREQQRREMVNLTDLRRSMSVVYNIKEGIK